MFAQRSTTTTAAAVQLALLVLLCLLSFNNVKSEEQGSIRIDAAGNLVLTSVEQKDIIFSSFNMSVSQIKSSLSNLTAEVSSAKSIVSSQTDALSNAMSLIATQSAALSSLNSSLLSVLKANSEQDNAIVLLNFSQALGRAQVSSLSLSLNRTQLLLRQFASFAETFNTAFPFNEGLPFLIDDRKDLFTFFFCCCCCSFTFINLRKDLCSPY